MSVASLLHLPSASRLFSIAILALAVDGATAVAQPTTPQAPAVQAGSVCASLPASIDPNALDSIVKDAWELVNKSRQPEAIACFDRALAAIEQAGAATAADTRTIEINALIGAGQAERGLARYTDAQRRHERALTLSREQHDAPNEGRSLRHLALDAYYLGQRDRAQSLLLDAKTIFEHLHDRPALALVYNNLMYVVPTGPEKDTLRDEALRSARDAKDRESECGILHEWGDELFDTGDYATAKTKLTESLACFESTTDVSSTGEVLVSLGRLNRAHGRVDIALAYYLRAFQLQEKTGDERAIIQSLNAIATAYDRLGNDDQAIAYFEKALARATANGSTQTVAFLKGQLGGHYLPQGEVERAIPLLEESLRIDPRHRAYRLAQLAEAYALVNRPANALDFANRSVDEARQTGQDELIMALERRAEVHRLAGRYTESSRDLSEALTIVETLRGNTIATDFMKRGFGSAHQGIYSASIDLLAQRGRTLEALATAEQARARAFLDLLATRSAQSQPLLAKNATPSAPAMASSSPSPSTSSSSTNTTNTTNETSAMRGAASRGGAATTGTEASTGEALIEVAAKDTLSSVSSAPVPTVSDVRATARRLRSTLVAYWVGQRTTHIWVVSPSGEIHSAHVDVTAARMRSLVAHANATIESASAGLGSRAGQTKPWRELYQTLIAPVRAFLPKTPNSLLTIVPHGPLFQVAFAALQDDRGTYLLERYRLHYTPSVGVLQFTSARSYGTPPQMHALLVGDPDPLPKLGDEDPMPALPWARREVDEIGKLIVPAKAEVFTGRDARESAIRTRIEQADLLHFATHGVVRQEEAFASFLALSDGGAADVRATAVRADSIAPATATAMDDGRLTADEVYGLHLSARLVVLSACRTALGPLTGDGIIGFTRAFLYAGASSVVATNWDVPDEAGYEVMRRFYRARTASGRTADALRAAQLAVLASLRNGTMRIETPGGPVAPGEHPLYWAGFLVVGEP